MIDIHNHLLVGIDDGPRSKAEMIALVKQAKSEGITGIVVTPHHLHPRYSNVFPQIEAMLTELKRDDSIQELGVALYPGQEVRITDTILTDIESGDIKGINHSKYLLIELPTNEVPGFTKQLLYEIQTRGFIPIIVHPERNRAIAKDVDLLFELISVGALSQLTSASLAGISGKNIQQLSMQIMDLNLAHFIASDAHHAERRPFLMQSLFKEKKLQGRQQMMEEMIKNGKRLIENKEINKEIPLQKKEKKKFFGLF